jgi:hypothetical protein
MEERLTEGDLNNLHDIAETHFNLKKSWRKNIDPQEIHFSVRNSFIHLA